MKRLILITLLIHVITSCKSVELQSPNLTLEYKIIVPIEWANGRSTPAFEGTGDITRYVHAYEKAWWLCMIYYAKDLNTNLKEVPLAISGWPAATYGWTDGMQAAIERIKLLRKYYGDQRVIDLLDEFSELNPEDYRYK